MDCIYESETCDYFDNGECNKDKSDCPFNGLEMEENNMGEIVRVYTDCLNTDGRGDFVRCSDCGELMLMQLGGTTCRECESENLQWADEKHQECSIEELEQLGYIVEEV